MLVLVLSQAPGTIPALAPSSSRACVTILLLSWPKHGHLAQGPLPGHPGASSGLCSSRSTAFLWDAHLLLLLPRKVTLLVVGLDNAGKTSVIMDIERGEEQHSSGAGLGWRQELYGPLQPSACALKDQDPSNTAAGLGQLCRTPVVPWAGLGAGMLLGEEEVHVAGCSQAHRASSLPSPHMQPWAARCCRQCSPARPACGWTGSR